MKSDLFEVFKEGTLHAKGPICGMGKALAKMPADDREATERALDDPTIYGSVISRVLRGRSLFVGADAVQRHRRMACTCRPLPPTSEKA